MSIAIGIIGDYDPAKPSHAATMESLEHAAAFVGIKPKISWLATGSLEKDATPARGMDGLWCSPGSPYQSREGALAGIRLARLEGIPFLGTCGGFQHAVLEYARNVLGFREAASEESDPESPIQFINKLECSLAGRRETVFFRPDSRAARLYGVPEALEGFACNYGINPKYSGELESGPLVVSGTDASGAPRVIELADGPFYLATLFLPQKSSAPGRPHPVIVGFLQACLERRRK
ncbi:MAG: hypothetical protein V1816_06335 [Pseudomonadota bacterium]